jgi:glycosyltransferase involved in cell wall biosynthesis
MGLWDRAGAVDEIAVMNVVIAGPFWFPRGTAATARIRNLALGLRECHARVHVLAMAPPPRMAGASRQGVLEFEGITYEHVAPIGAAVDGWLDADRTIPRLRRRLLDRLAWFGSTSGATLAARKRLRRLIDRGECDLLLIYDSSALRMTPLVRLSRARGVTSILDVVETAEQLCRERSAGPLDVVANWDIAVGLSKTATLFDGLTVITTGLEAFYRERGCLKTLVLPSIESWPAAPPPEPTANRSFRLTSVGSLLPRDAPELLLEAMRILAQRGVDVTLDLVGHYEATAGGRRLRELCAQDPALGRVVLGALSDAALQAQLLGSDGLVLTRRQARTEELSFPTRLVEYLRFGRPVFVSAVGDISRYLKEGEAVFLDPGDARGMAEAIAAVASRPDRGALIGCRGREAGARAFDRKTHAARLLEFAAGLLAGSPR